ncbi:MAG: hypothetical protein NC308_01820 [Clostridium sp.]|nr:hypothetical protein [Bacteroides sp.]MCM1197605.1 hypothetical protein [Clostridium sp.]
MKSVIYRYTFIAVMAAVLCGCHDRNVSVILDTGETDILNFSEIHLSQEMPCPTRMIFTEGKIVIYQHKGDTLFTVIPDPLSGKCHGARLKGRGPGEFIDIDVQSIAPCKDGFICLDADGKVKQVDLSGKGIKVTGTRGFKSSNQPQNGVVTSNGYVSANVTSDKSEFIIYNGSDRPLYAGEYPDWTDASKEELPFVYMKNMVARPSGERFAAFYVFFRKLRIIDNNGAIVKDIDVRVPDQFPEYSSDYHETSLAYASYPSATPENIYALCCNRKASQYGEIMPEIHIFDRSGKMKRRILPDKHIDIFAIDEHNGIIYGCDVSRPDVLLYGQL